MAADSNGEEEEDSLLKDMSKLNISSSRDDVSELSKLLKDLNVSSTAPPVQGLIDERVSVCLGGILKVGLRRWLVGRSCCYGLCVTVCW